MTVVVERADLERFRTLLALRLGLHFDDGKLDYLTGILRLRALGAAEHRVAPYLASLSSGAGTTEEFLRLAEILTVPETYFFRNADQFRALAEAVLPARIRAQASRRQLCILSAGCASGEEAYTIAITIREHFPELATWNLRIVGVDVNPAVVEKARLACYPTWSLRETPKAARDRWFHAEGRDFALDAQIRQMVSFEQRNLVDEDHLFWQPGVFDLVFCRNVTMYFAPEVTRSVVERVTRSLAPGGFLFLGHAETLRGISHEFHLRHTHDTFYYERKEAGARASMSDLLGQTPMPPIVEPPLLVPPEASWVEAIQRASERIVALAEKAGSPAAQAKPAHWDRAALFELVGQERFSDALQLLGSLPVAAQNDADAQLVHAVLLIHGGKLRDAEQMATALLASDDLSAGAHYVMALCHEHAGQLREAFDHDQVAVYLDPEFAMPRLHLGLLARRAADLPMARRELRLAVELFAREEASRILLFGGGFGREALIRLCEAELRACGGGA